MFQHGPCNMCWALFIANNFTCYYNYNLITLHYITIYFKLITHSISCCYWRGWWYSYVSYDDTFGYNFFVSSFSFCKSSVTSQVEVVLLLLWTYQINQISLHDLYIFTYIHNIRLCCKNLKVSLVFCLASK